MIPMKMSKEICDEAEALLALESFFARCKSSKEREALQWATVALFKGIAKEPILEDNSSEFTSKCPTCEALIFYDYPNDTDYCKKCGQKIIWKLHGGY